jgi:hypothetical protein
LPDKKHEALLKELQELAKKARLIPKDNTGTLTGFFHLTSEENDTRRAGIKELTFSERAHLSTFHHVAAGEAWLDLGEILAAEITIDDLSSKEREERPYAHIRFPSDLGRPEDDRRLTIDILKSIRNDARCIGHPVVLFAVDRWQQVLLARAKFERGDIYTRNGNSPKRVFAKSLNRVFSGEKDVEVAERNLKEIGNALLRGIASRAISNEAAFSLMVGEWQLEKSPLREAWKLLKAPRARDRAQANDPVRVKTIRSHLKKQARNSDWRLSVETVTLFLKTAGKEFVGADEDGKSQRPNWKAFRKAFVAWRSVVRPETVQQYIKRAKKESVDPNVIYTPTLFPPPRSVRMILNGVLTTPLILVPDSEQ